MYGLWAVLIRVCTLVLAEDVGSLVQQLIQSRQFPSQSALTILLLKTTSIKSVSNLDLLLTGKL